MTDTKTFFFAVKPGHDPVQVKSLSAHDTIEWVGKGYGCFGFNFYEDQEVVYPADSESFCNFCVNESGTAFLYDMECSIDDKIFEILGIVQDEYDLEDMPF